MSYREMMERAERASLGLIRDAGLPDPDRVEHGEHELRLIWLAPKVAVVIELDETEQ